MKKQMKKLFKGSDLCFWEKNQAFGSCDSSWGAKSLTPDGPTPQISVAYSVMVRSLENLPEAAILHRHMRAHSMGFWYSSLTRR